MRARAGKVIANRVIAAEEVAIDKVTIDKVVEARQEMERLPQNYERPVENRREDREGKLWA